MEVKLYNSLTRKIEEFKPIDKNLIKIYSCGPTVYNYSHIGNMRAFLFADLVQKVLKHIANYNIHWVMNITNIDDKTIRDSKPNSNAWKAEMGVQSGNAFEDLNKLTAYYEKAFIADMHKLGIEKSDLYAMPRATEYINEMQSLIKKIMDKGLAYISEGSIYFNVSEYCKTNTYGKLFKIDFDNFKPGMRIDSDQYEREQVNDFVLWKKYKPDEPFWDFEIDGQNYPGRPGWHIECSAMEYELLGLPFDIHTGGIDLKFPHHEDEIAQSKAGYGIEPTNYWCHNEFLEVEGEKMSKSLGNFFTLRDLEDKNIDILDVRYSMLSAHYRTKYNFTFNGINAAKKARTRLQEYIYSIINNLDDKELEEIKNAKVLSTDIKTDKIQALANSIFEELTNDFHTPKALSYLFTFINNNKSASLSKEEQINLLYLISVLNRVFGVWTFEKKAEEVNEDIPANIIELANQRLAAKKDKNYAEADRLRNEITSLGYNILDTKEGFKINKI